MVGEVRHAKAGENLKGELEGLVADAQRQGAVRNLRLEKGRGRSGG